MKKYIEILTKDFLIKEYIENEKTTTKIAEQVGCGKSTISNYLKKYAIKIRNCCEHKLNCQCFICKGKRGESHVPNCQCCSCKTKRGEVHKLNCQCAPCKAKRGECNGKNSSNFKDGRTLKKYYCIEDCNNEISYVNWRRGNKRCQSCSKKSANNPNWHGGIGNLPYSFEFTQNLKDFIRKRDKYTCQKCNIIEEEHLIVYGKVLAVHHIDYNKQNCKEENLITVCISCNSKANIDRDYWYAYFTYIMEEN